MPSRSSRDDTVKVFRAFLAHLPKDGQLILASEILELQYSSVQLRELRNFLVDAVLKPSKVSPPRTVGTGYGVHTSLFRVTWNWLWGPHQSIPSNLELVMVVSSAAEGPIRYQWTILSAVYNLLESDPVRFSERPENPAYTDTVFHAGHSPEDWYRGLKMWEHFGRARRHGRKYASNTALPVSNSPWGPEDGLSYAETTTGIRARVEQGDYQNTALALAREPSQHVLHAGQQLIASKADNPKQCHPMLNKMALVRQSNAVRRRGKDECREALSNHICKEV